MFGRVGLCCWFCDFAVSFLVPPDGPKNGTVKMLFFCSFTKLCMRSQKWDRQLLSCACGPKNGTARRSHFWDRVKLFIFIKFFASGLKKRNVLVSTEALWLMATGKATVPNLNAFCLNNRSCHFCLDGSAFAVDLRFCGLIFGTARRSQKWDRENAFLLFFTKLCMRSQKWDRQLLSCACGPKNGTARRSHFWDRVKFHFYKVFCIRVEEAQCFGFNRSFVAYGDRKGNCSKSKCFLLK